MVDYVQQRKDINAIYTKVNQLANKQGKPVTQSQIDQISSNYYGYGNEGVVIDKSGQGYSVAPSKQQAFVSSPTGSGGYSLNNPPQGFTSANPSLNTNPNFPIAQSSPIVPIAAAQAIADTKANSITNQIAERDARQREQSYSINNSKSFLQTVKDIRERQDTELNSNKMTNQQILQNPIKALGTGLSNAWEYTSQGVSNIGTMLSGTFGYGVYTTPTFENKTQLKQSGATLGGFGIPIFAIPQVLKQRDIGEQGLNIQQTFSKNLNASQTNFGNKYNQLINSSNVFTGTEGQYKQYQTDFSNLNQSYNKGINTLQMQNLGATNSSGSFNFNPPTKIIAQIYANGTGAEKRVATANVIIGKGAEAFTGGLALKGLGVIGGIERGASFISSSSSIGKVGTVVVGSALAISPPVISGIEGYSSFKQAGASGKTGAIIGTTTGAVEVSSFMTGASAGEFLFVPGLKVRSFGMPDKVTGKFPTKVLGFENPFGKGSYPIVTKTTDGFSFGYPKEIKGSTFNLTPDIPISDYSIQASSKTEVAFFNKAISNGGNRLGTEQLIFEKGIDLTQGLSGVKIKDISVIPFEKSNVFKNLQTQSQKDLVIDTFSSLGEQQKGIKGFFNALNGRGLERLYGSSTTSTEGGFKTNVMRTNSEFGDFDLNFYDNAIPKAQKLYTGLKSLGADVKITESLIEIKNPSTNQYEHAFDFHGVDTPDLQMKNIKLGINGVNTKQFNLNSGSLKGQQLRQSLVDKGSATLQLRVNKNNQFYFSPPDYRMKDVSDFVSISERLNEVKGGNVFGPKIESYKNLLKVAYPEIKFGGESKLIFGSIGQSKSNPFNLGISSVSSLGVNKKSNGLSMNNLNRASSFSFSPSKSSTGSISISSFSVSSSQSQFSSFSPSVSPSKSFSPSGSPSFGSPSPSPSSSMSPSPSRSQSPYGSPSPSPYASQSNFNLTGMPTFPSLGGYAEPKRKKRGRKGPFDISPSFTGIVANIQMKNTLKVSRSLGVLPGQMRGLLPVGSKKKYFKLVDF